MNTWENYICAILLAWSKHLFDYHEVDIIINIISKNYLKNHICRIIILVCQGLISWILSLHWEGGDENKPSRKMMYPLSDLFPIIDTHETICMGPVFFSIRTSKDNWKSLDLASLNLSLTPERARRDGTVTRKGKWTLPGIAEMLNRNSCYSSVKHQNTCVCVFQWKFYRFIDYSMCKKNGKWVTVEISSR